MDRRTSTRSLFLHYVAIVLLCRGIAEGRQAIPVDNLAYPVLVVVDNRESASGFYIRTERDLYFATARHVLFKEEGEKNSLKGRVAACLSYPKDPNDPGRFLVLLNLSILQTEGLIRPHENRDAVVVQVGEVAPHAGPEGEFSVSLGKGVRMVEKSAHSTIVAVDIGSTKRSGHVLASNDVFIFGYPSSIGIREMPQLHPEKPLLRKGIVAGKGINGESIIIDCPSYYGNSGGPVLEVEQASVVEVKYRVIGLISEFVPFKETWVNTTHKTSHWEISNSGYSVVTPIDAILELISEKRAKDSSGAGEEEKLQ